ncbi:MAG: hypothetical protein HS126_21985 [Anaerolineales bacterium]|nr:hypothetical protein [Anaerolineales bacterium]
MVVDAKGNEKVVLDLAVWQEILAVLEEADAERRWDELFAKSPDMLVRLADEARAERRAGRTRDLDPDSL